MTNITPPLADVPVPAGAVEIRDWEIHPRTGESVVRQFDGSSWVVPAYEDNTLDYTTCGGETQVWIQGAQLPDGRTKRDVWTGEDNPRTLENARQFAEAILAACDEAERMNAADTTGGVA